METIPPDWKEFLNALRSANTRFLLIGAHALAYHVEARLTEDLDVFVEPSVENAQRLQLALNSFGFGDVGPSLVRRAGARTWLMSHCSKRRTTKVSGGSKQVQWAV